jgi:hypothetical protein
MIPNTTKSPDYKLPFNNVLADKNKSNFELVITRFNENIGWSDNYEKFRTIYNKGKSDLNCEYIQRENFGRDGETILYHIIHNWDNLSDVTFFAQAALNDRNDQILSMNDVDNCINCKNMHVCKKKQGPPPNQKYYDFPKKLGEIWSEIFNEPYSRNYTWGPGMWISVTREVIKNVPLDKYKQLLDMWHKYHDKKNDPTARLFGIYLERILPPFFRKYN